MNRDCGVMAADEADIPEKWRAKTLGEIRTGVSKISKYELILGRIKLLF